MRQEKTSHGNSCQKKIAGPSVSARDCGYFAPRQNRAEKNSENPEKRMAIVAILTRPKGGENGRNDGAESRFFGS